ncbi:MAG: S-layer protein [Candidatus Aenigmarchaeota archaeon]|nr:S-layer protein [Candidatus Aenigmarchaeota archaeon]
MKEKIIASILAAIIALAPIVSAAVTLGDYPTFLFKDHNLNAYVVVGSAAQPADVVGAVDLAVRLAGESYEEVSTTGETTVAGGTSEDIPLGEPIAASGLLDATLKKYKLPGLQESSVSFQDDSYDFHEEIIVADNTGSPASPSVETALTTNDWDMGSNVYLLTNKNSLKYRFVFDENIDLTKATNDEPLEIDFLGKRLTITNVSLANQQITVRVGEEYTLNVGDSATVAGKKVTLKNVGSSGTSAVVDVDGVVSTVGTTQKTVNGLKIQVKETFYSETLSERMATLLIGTETTKTYTHGQEFIGEDKNNPNWKWDLSGLTASPQYIGIQNEFVKDSYSKSPATLGGCYEFPYKYAKVCLEKLTVDDYSEYTFKADTGVDLSNAGGSTNEKVLTIVSGSKEGIVLGSVKTDTVYLKYNTTSADGKLSVYYKDTNNKVQYFGDVGNATLGQINYKDTKGTDMVLKVQNALTTGFYLVVDDIASSNDLVMRWTISSDAIDHLGTNADQKDSDELWYGSQQIGTKEKDLRSEYGYIIATPSTNGDRDQVVLRVPADQVKAKVVVYGPGGTSSTTEGGKIKKVVPVTTTVAKLDTEVDPTTVDKHLVLVGGPAVNRLTAQAMGLSFPTYGSSGMLPFGEGEAYIKVYDGVFKPGQVVVVVAGWEAENTRMATSLLQQFDTFAGQLGSNTAVKVTSLSASGIKPA